MEFDINNYKIGIIGLGYVGLPMAISFGKKTTTIGFDINESRVKSLKNNHDKTGEVNENEIKKSNLLKITSDSDLLKLCNCYIVTVPTPIDKNKKPDLNPLISACNIISKYIKNKDIVIFESTVYPGCTEEVCIPIIENKSGLIFNKDFFAGYSPERIVPGNSDKTFENIIKVTSGSNHESSIIIDNIYKTVVKAGTYLAPSIKVAEASKAIENSQRDLNISFFNELAILCSKLNINTKDVIDAASTKWNFIRLKPGLVGGHCIGVDPYYLIHKAKEIGFSPNVINSGRKTNESIAKHIVNQCLSYLLKTFVDKKINEISFLLIGFTFKPDCNDIRNTGVFNLYNEINKLGFSIDVYDPKANFNEVKEEYDIKITDKLKKYSCIIYCVNHSEFSNINLNAFKQSNNSMIYDVTGTLNKNEYTFQL